MECITHSETAYVSKIGFIVVGCLHDCAAILTLKANDDDLYNYTVLTRGILEITREMRLRRNIDDLRQREMTWVHRLALGTWEGTPSGTLFGKRFKLVLLTVDDH